MTGNPVTLTCTLKLQSAGWKFYWIKDSNETETETSHYFIKSVSVSDGEKPKPVLISDLKEPAMTGNPVTLTCTLKLQSAGWKFYWIKDSNETETETSHYFIKSVSVSDG
ncbi:carcinoembryonic antigen-related cell adhesion molecule 5-like, partial [Clarias magur]